jgi:phage major head subunit gpT-like protein
MIITSANLANLNRGFRTLFLDAYQGGGYTPRVDSYAMPTTSSSAEEFYGWLAAVPGLRELLGEITIRNIADLNYSVKNREFESTIGVKRKDVERDNFGMYNMLFTAMGVAAKEHPDELLFAAMIAGFTTTCYTGKNFFDTNHEPIKGKTKFSNLGTKKLSATNFTTARTNIKSRRNTEGRPMNLGRELVLVVSPDNEDLGKQILQADFIQQTAKNVAGAENIGVAAVSNTLKGSARLDVCPLLSSNPDMWFLLELGYPIKPFINQIEVATEFVSLTDPKQEHVLLFKEWLHQAYRRGNVGYALPELAYGSTGADAA